MAGRTASKAEDVAKLRSWNLISDWGSCRAGRGHVKVRLWKLDYGAHADLTPRRDCHRRRHGGTHREGYSRKDVKATGYRVKNPSCVLWDRRLGPSSHWVVLCIRPQVGTPGLDRFLLLCVVHAKQHCSKPGSASVSREV